MASFDVSDSLYNGSLVAGASAEGHGVLTDWFGRGDRTHEQLLDIVTIADIPREWMPRVKDARVHLSRALQHVAGAQYRVRPVRKPAFEAYTSGDSTLSEDDLRRLYDVAHGWTARYSVERLSQGTDVRAGEPTGNVALVATLWESESGANRIAFDTAPDDPGAVTLRDAALLQYDRRVAVQRYEARDITLWLGDVLRRRLGAVRYGRAWYIPRASRTIAEGLIEALRGSGWGHSWMYPPLPIATSAQLSRGLAIGLQEEVAAIVAEIEVGRTAARDAGREDLGTRSCARFTGLLNEVSARFDLHRELLGNDEWTNGKNVVADALIIIDGILEKIAEDGPAMRTAEMPALGG